MSCNGMCRTSCKAPGSYTINILESTIARLEALGPSAEDQLVIAASFMIKLKKITKSFLKASTVDDDAAAAKDSRYKKLFSSTKLAGELEDSLPGTLEMEK